ncbi:TniQ family protein [Psychromonas sp. L1A2]|uniref:TniQ family protein n=1 Tax=Psychromonas sp. L1A2 TaxID=2686356 RepID=UPI00135B7D09|nr:TniQ family protein [Psychromonas sp. L1A2]
MMFLVRPTPLNNEHLLSFILRLSIANGFKNTIQLLRCIDIPLTNNRLPPKKVALGDFPTELLQKAINLKAKPLSSTLFHQAEHNWYRFKQLTIPAASINFSKPTFCPQCFCEELKHPVQHLLLPMTHCSKHHCALIDFNPSNGKRLTWSTADLLTIMDKATSTVIKEVLPTVTSNISKLGLTSAERLLVGKQQFNLKNYLVLLHFFFHYHQRSITSPTKRAQQLSNKQRVHLYNIANEYLNNWPTGFYGLLNRFLLKPMAQRGETGIRHYFRDLYDEIYSGSLKGIFAYQFLMSAFEDYLENEFSESAFTNSLTRIEAPLHNSATCICEKSAAQLLNIPVSHLKLFVNAGLVTLQDNGTFLKKDIVEFIVKAKDFITLTETTELLEIGKSQVVQLVDSGLLKYVIHPNDELRDWLFDKKELQAFTSKIKDCITTPHKLPTSFKSSTFKALTFNGDCISTVIENIVINKTAVIYTENPNNPLSLQQFHPCFDVSLQPNKYVSPKQASKILGVNINAIYDFAKRGFLIIEKQQVGRTARPVKLIPKYSIDSFKNNYVLNKHFKSEDKHKFELISGPAINGGLVNLYVRSTS